MKKVFLVFDQLPHKKDGGLIATYVRFIQTFSDKYEISIVSIFNNGGNDIEELNSTPIINFSEYNIDNRFFKAVSYLKKGRFKDCLHAIFSAIAFFLFIPVARKKSVDLLSDAIIIASSPAAAIFISKQIRYILEVHTKFEYFWGSNLIGRLQSALIPKPALAIFRNKADAKKAAKKFPSGYIYNGFDNSTIPHQTEIQLRNRRPFSALYVGGLVEHKNPMMLLECAQLIKKEIPSFSLDIYGTGNLERKLEKEIAERGLQNTVKLRGFTEDKSVYSNYELFWFTSKLDGFGLVLIESMANATPVITTDWGDGVFEVIKNGETGFIVESEKDFINRSIELFKDPEKRILFGQNAQLDFEERFTMKKNEEQWIRILDSFTN